VICSLAIIVGFKTRFAAIPPLITMMVAISIVHANDPWSKKEFALLYAIPFLVLIFTGAGAYSVDAKLKKSPKKSSSSK
jgi:putative oxidoreductase